MSATILVAIFLITSALGCSTGRKPSETPRPVQVTVLVPETRVVLQTRPVVQTVIVTPAPTTAPAYVSRISAPPGTLRYPLSGDPQTFDPQAAVDDSSLLIAGQIFESLYTVESGATLVPAAARDYKVSTDGRVYTVTLRSGLLWSDGRPLSAQDFVAGVCRLLDPALGNRDAYLLTDVAAVSGARAYATGEQPGCEAVGVRAIDALTLQVTLERPWPEFPQMFASRAFLPGLPSESGLAAVGAPASASGASANGAGQVITSAIIGNGPYVVAEWQPGDHVTLVKNAHYRDAAAVNIARIEMPIIAAPATRLAAYEAGQIHVSDVPAEEVPQIREDAGLRAELHSITQPGTSFLGLNVAAGPTGDVNFRRALASAIDRKAILTDTLHEPWHVIARTLVPPGLASYQGQDPAVGYPFDLQKVKQFLTQAGYGPSAPIPTINLWANREGHNQELALSVADAFESAGIPTRLTLSNWEAYQRSLQACQQDGTANATPAPQDAAPGAATPTPPPAPAASCGYNVYLMGWLTDVPDPGRFLDQALGIRPALAYNRWTSDPYEKLLAQARAETDSARRVSLYQQAEKLLLNDAAVVIPLFHYDRSVLIKPELKFDYPLFGPPHFQYWRLPAS
jgi:oligopeptide transport system substrate-binding protein